MRLKPLQQQVVVVFGASSGIGRETALRFARKGAKVAAASNDAHGLQTLVEEITGAGGQAVGMVADAVEFAQVQAVARETVRRFGRLDTWVHAAAVSVYATFEQTTPEGFARILTVNVMGQVHGIKAALPYMKQGQGGALIVISSVEAQISLPFNSAYAASKHALHGIAQALRLELNHDKAPVSLTEIMPASIDTPLFGKAGTKLGVEPMGIPPVYPASMVADAILYAATHPIREIVVGNAGKMMLLTNRFAPLLLDAMLEKIAFEGQKSTRAKSPTAADNLYGPVGGLDQVKGAEIAKEKEKVQQLTAARNGKTNGNGANVGSRALPLAGTVALAGMALMLIKSRH